MYFGVIQQALNLSVQKSGVLIVSLKNYTPITYYWTVPLILHHSYLVGNLTNSKIAETKASEPLKF